MCDSHIYVQGDGRECRGATHVQGNGRGVSHVQGDCRPGGRRATCLALRFQTGSWMLFIDSRNSNKMAAFYTVQTSSIRISNCLYFPDMILKTH